MICTKCQKEVEYTWEYNGEYICQSCLEDYNVDWHIKDGKLMLNKD